MHKFYGLTLLLAAFGLVWAAPAVRAEDEAEIFDLGDTIFAEDSPYDLGGWTQWGYTNNSTGLFNTNPHKFNNHQSWVYFEKAVDGSEGVDFGGRVDFMYGTDADDTQMRATISLFRMNADTNTMTSPPPSTAARRLKLTGASSAGEPMCFSARLMSA